MALITSLLGLVSVRHELAAWLRSKEVGLPRWIVKKAAEACLQAAEEKRRRRRHWKRECALRGADTGLYRVIKKKAVRVI